MIRRLAVLALLALALPGCALISESPAHVGGHATLGDAAAAANPDSSRKQKRLDVGYTIPPESASEVSISSSSSEAGGPESLTAEDDGGGGNHAGVLGVVAGGGAIGGASYDGFGEFGLDLGFYLGSRSRLDLIGAISPIQFADESIAGQSFLDEFDLTLDVSVRYYLTPPHTFLGVWPVAGMRFGTLFWDYAKPVPIVEDGVPRTVDSDQIDHFSLYGGLGLSLVQARHFQIGTQLTGGARLYGGDTRNGFSNTLFADVGFLQVRCEAMYRF